MAQAYYTAEQVAKMLGASPADVTAMQQRNELRGFRDGASWKFKTEDIDALVAERASGGGDQPDDGGGDVLLSEVELGASDVALSGSVIGGDKQRGSAVDSDLQLGAASGLELGDENASSGEGSGSGLDDLDLTLEEDVSLEDSQLGTPGEGGSTVDLTGKDLDDDDLVLGGSGTGSDITIGGDSGISLVDPADSGLSLSEPLELGESDSSTSLQLGEDDMISLGEETDMDAPTELKTDDDFLLTPLEEAADDESESGSQVIALDTEGEGDEAATMIAGSEAGGMAAMLDEDLGAQPAGDFGVGADAAAMGAQPGALDQGAALGQPAAVLPEAPYSVWNIASLSLCVIVLVFGGWFMYDLMRNMWSWQGTHEVTSPLMDWILGLFES